MVRSIKYKDPAKCNKVSKPNKQQKKEENDRFKAMLEKARQDMLSRRNKLQEQEPEKRVPEHHLPKYTAEEQEEKRRKMQPQESGAKISEKESNDPKRHNLDAYTENSTAPQGKRKRIQSQEGSVQNSRKENTGPQNSTIKTDKQHAKKRRIEQTQNTDPLNLLNIKTDNQHAKQRRFHQAQNTHPLSMINIKTDNQHAKQRRIQQRIEQTQTSDPLNLLNIKTDNQHAKQRRIEQTQYTGPLNLINMCTIGNGEEQVEQRRLKKAEQEREAERKQRENREQIPRKYRDQIEAQRRLELIRNPDPLNLMGQCTVNIYDSRYQEILPPAGQAGQVITRERRQLMCEHWQERKDSIKGDLFPDAMELSHFEEKHHLQHTGPVYDSPSYLGEGDLPRLRSHNLW